MKFEKVNNDKIKITLSNADLEANDIDYHSFMSDSNETRSLFLSVLDKAERDYGFSTDNYQLKVETLALENGTFILTITRSLATNEPPKKRLRVSRKTPNISAQSLIYRFNSFDDLCAFANSLYDNIFIDLKSMAKNNSLYLYNNFYYLVFEKMNINHPNLKVLYSSITEFSTYVKYSDVFVAKMMESGKLIMKNNAIKTCQKYFL